MKYITAGFILLFYRFNCIFAQCPRSKLIQPCTCPISLLPSIVCDRIDNTHRLAEVFNRSAGEQFEKFGLSRSTIAYLPAESLTSKNISILVIGHSAMVSLFDTEPDTENVLFAMALLNVRFQRGVRWELFKNLKRLDLLKVEDTEIKSLGGSFVEYINPELTSLTLKNTTLRRLHPNAFQKLEKLEDLAIRNCFVTVLKRSMFSTTSVLRTIDFSGNQIKSLPADIFSEMPKLEEIYLNDNKISTVSEAVFKNTYGNVHSIHLKNNPLKCDCSLKWFLNKEHQQVLGQCDFPADKKGKELENLTEADFDYCR